MSGLDRLSEPWKQKKKKIQDTIKYGKHDVFYNPHIHYILNT